MYEDMKPMELVLIASRRLDLTQVELAERTGLSYDQVNLALNGRGSKIAKSKLKEWLSSDEVKSVSVNWHNF